MARILLTVGSQMPFDRLTRAVARWARGCRTPMEILAQTGLSALPADETWPLRCVPTLSPSAYRQACQTVDLIVAHAGMGSILTALELQRPLVVMPRRGPFRETRNDHQLHTAQALLAQASAEADASAAITRSAQGLWVALDERALPAVLDQALAALPTLGAGPGRAETDATRADVPPARRRLIDQLRGVIESP